MAGGGVFREDLGKEMNSKQKTKTTITVLTAGATTKQTRQETPPSPFHLMFATDNLQIKMWRNSKGVF